MHFHPVHCLDIDIAFEWGINTIQKFGPRKTAPFNRGKINMAWLYIRFSRWSYMVQSCKETYALCKRNAMQKKNDCTKQRKKSRFQNSIHLHMQETWELAKNSITYTLKHQTGNVAEALFKPAFSLLPWFWERSGWTTRMSKKCSQPTP